MKTRYFALIVGTVFLLVGIMLSELRSYPTILRSQLILDMATNWVVSINILHNMP